MSEDHRTKEDSLLTRRELAGRWKVSIETIKRCERTKILRPMRLYGRIVRYRMSDVLRIEREGCGD
jgi:DNA-binding transcriptional regulator YhcF (GntR family)